ncbi:MAG TPA: hypothetical protein VIU82_25115 [Bosea sp. (in: a-proteobacteria)]
MKDLTRVSTYAKKAVFPESLHFVMPDHLIDLARQVPPTDALTQRLPSPRVLLEHYRSEGSFFYAITEFSLGEFGVSAFVVADGDTRLVFHDVNADLWEDGNLHFDYPETPVWGEQMDYHTLVRDLFAAPVAFLRLLSVRGIAQERVEPSEKLNKKRRLHGKPAIQPYIRLVVGQVYDREGNAIPEHERRHVRPHIRAGHSRRQHHGPQNSLIKTIHIPSTVVNYGSGDILPDRPRVFVQPREKGHAVASRPEQADAQALHAGAADV